jgi:hypothetical protein
MEGLTTWDMKSHVRWAKWLACLFSATKCRGIPLRDARHKCLQDRWRMSTPSDKIQSVRKCTLVEACKDSNSLGPGNFTSIACFQNHLIVLYLVFVCARICVTRICQPFCTNMQLGILHWRERLQTLWNRMLRLSGFSFPRRWGFVPVVRSPELHSSKHEILLNKNYKFSPHLTENTLRLHCKSHMANSVSENNNCSL